MQRYRQKTRERPADKKWASLALAVVAAIVSIFGGGYERQSRRSLGFCFK